MKSTRNVARDSENWAVLCGKQSHAVNLSMDWPHRMQNQVGVT